MSVGTYIAIGMILGHGELLIVIGGKSLGSEGGGTLSELWWGSAPQSPLEVTVCLS